jgi:exodeoxyribonuclease V alpha subunit
MQHSRCPMAMASPIKVLTHRKTNIDIYVNTAKRTIQADDLVYPHTPCGVKNLTYPISPKQYRLLFDGCYIQFDELNKNIISLRPPYVHEKEDTQLFLQALLKWCYELQDCKDEQPIFGQHKHVSLLNHLLLAFGDSDHDENDCVLDAWQKYLENTPKAGPILQQMHSVICTLLWYYDKIKLSQTIKFDSQRIGLPLTLKESATVLWYYDKYEDFRKNPYSCIHDPDKPYKLRFNPIDKLAKLYNVDRDVICKENILYTLNEITESEGHACFPRDALMHTVCVKMRHSHPTIGKDEIETQMSLQYAYNNFVYQPSTFKIERAISNKITEFLDVQHDEAHNKMLVKSHDELMKYVQDWQSENCVKLNTLQVYAIEQICLEANLFILTGFPGTGKSSVVRFIKYLCAKQNNSLLLCAPTGKAANVLGAEAMTLHRALGCMVDDKGRMTFSVNSRNQIRADIIVIDESSMLDNVMAHRLLSSINPLKTKLLIIGDKRQLPPVSYGDFMGELIRSDVIPCVELTQIYRQGKGSAICKFAKMISQNKISQRILTDYPDEIKWVTLENDNETLEYVKNLYLKTKSQILCPGKKGMVGIPQLNGVIHNALFPLSGDKMCVDDRVVCSKNSYARTPEGIDMEKSAFNGELGKIVTGKRKSAIIAFDNGKIIELDYDVVEWAYSITVHRSQGSEYPEVILVLSETHDFLLTQELLYTAVTRAKGKLVIISNEYCILKAAATKTPKRYTNIAAMINENYVT